LTKLIQPFDPVVKDRFFYNRFEYSIGFHIDEASCMRKLDHDYIDSMIQRRIAWRDIAQQKVAGTIKSSLSGNPHTILSRRHKDITDKTVDDLHMLAELLLTTESDFKLVVSAGHAYVYTNDLLLIDLVSELSGVTQKYYSQAVVGRPKDTIQLKDPQHRFRSYFKLVKLTDIQKHNLLNFLNNYKESVRLSPALQRWIAVPLVRTQDYFFIDYNEPAWLTMLSLVQPGLIRKTMQIITAK